MGEQFCLKWNNHQSTLISLFDSLLDTQKHVDCSISSEGQILNAHKVVLSACSPYLEKLLNQAPDKYPLLVFSDIKFDELRAMLEYMYRGEVNVLQEQLNGFLKAAETLQIKGLADQGGGGGGGDTGGGGGKRKLNSIPDRHGDDSCHSPATSTPLGGGAVKRRRRRPSQESDSHIESGNSCDTPAPTQASSSQPLVTKPAPLTETDRLNTSAPPPALAVPPPAKIEAGEMVQPKTEYLEENNDEQIEDLTMDDDDEEESYMAKPGTSLATNDNSQGYDSNWQFSGDTSNQEMFMGTQQDPIGNQSNSQGPTNLSTTSPTVASKDTNPPPAPPPASIPPLGKQPVCLSCGRVFDHLAELTGHLLLECGKPKRLQCPDCSFSGDTLTALNAHKRAFHAAKPVFFSCGFCPYSGKTKGHLEQHMYRVHRTW